jgi:hypothetical protein
VTKRIITTVITVGNSHHKENASIFHTIIVMGKKGVLVFIKVEGQIFGV